MAKTVKPSGLSITRQSLKFTLTWKIADKDYDDGQEFQWRTNNTKAGLWHKETIGKTATAKSVSFSASDYNPAKGTKLTSITFRVRGKRKPFPAGSGPQEPIIPTDWSAWSEKTINLSVPAAPKVTAELSDTHSNVTTFEWETETSATDKRPFVQTEWQTIRVKNSTVTDGSSLTWKSSKDGWSTGTSTANGSRSFTEDSAILANASYTRWFRIRSRGASGDSAWKYAKHVYSIPKQAQTSKATASTSDGTTTVDVTWSATSNAANPIDETVVQYAIGVPAADRAVPPGQSWTDAMTTKDTKGKDASKFVIDTTLGYDQCLWTRILTKHDNNITYSAPSLVKSGKLTAPSGLTVEINADTKRATVTATNNSAVPDSKLAVVFRNKDSQDTVVGVIAHGQTTITVKCPDWESGDDIALGVYAYQGTESYTLDGALRTYTINANMRSANSFSGGDVPSAPDNLTAELTDIPGEVLLKWSWSWKTATSAEISWSKNPNAWTSTDQPSTFTVRNLDAGRWRVSGLETGVKWYFRIRLTAPRSDGQSYGPYSETVEIDLSTIPQKPVLTLSESVITATGSVTASWVFVSDDGTSQGGAILYMYTESGGSSSAVQIANLETEQSVTLAEDWDYGETYYFYVKTFSSGGRESEASDAVPLTIADPVTCSITYTSLVETSTPVYDPETSVAFIRGSGDVIINSEVFAEAVGMVDGAYCFYSENGRWYYVPGNNVIGYGRIGSMQFLPPEVDPADYGISTPESDVTIVVTLTTHGETVTELSLTAMPLSVTASGGDTLTMIVERAEEYHMLRPDETDSDGYDGETIIIARQQSPAEFIVGIDDLVGRLDDGAHYRLIVTAEDDMGQMAQAEPIEFAVHWTHQADMPSGTELVADRIAIITAAAPEGYASGDVCDIYRLSADKPELIVQNGDFGVAYVDPYPAIGKYGHRIVHRTSNGDYITSAYQPAWFDTEGTVSKYGIIIDFDGVQAVIPYNVTLSNKWTKDFKTTNYLGGSQAGDWNPAVSRTATYTAILMSDEDKRTVAEMRALAAYSGICHIRTPEGSSYAANVDVAENKSHSDGGTASFTLTVTRVDPEALDGVTLEDWEHGSE